MNALEQLAEIEAVKNLRIQYSRYFDGKQIDALADLFTEDAAREFGLGYGGDWVGKAQIHADSTQYAEAEGPPHGGIHAVTNPLIRLVDETTAHGRWCLLGLRTKEGWKTR